MINEVKVCGKCGQEKPAAQFRLARRNRSGLSSYCLVCHSAYQKVYGAKRRRVIKAKLDALKAAPCMDCGGRFLPEAMDFDHVRAEKEFAVSRATQSQKSWDKALKEIAKCDLVCANCHRVRTHKRKLARPGLVDG